MLNFDFISDEKYSSILIRPWKQKQKKNKTQNQMTHVPEMGRNHPEVPCML